MLLALCAALVLLVRVVGGAPLPRWTYFVPPLVGALLWPLLSVLLQWPQRPVRSRGDAVTARRLRASRRWPAFSSRRRGRDDGGALRRAARCATPSARLFLFRRRLAIAGALVLARVRRAVRALRLPAGRPARATTRRSPRSNRIAIVPIAPNRGVITDRNGVVLAQSYSAYTLEIQPARVAQPRRRRSTSSRQIVDIQPRDRKRFRKLLDESKNFESLPLRTRLTDEEVARFAVNRYRFPGVEIKARLFRQYPFGEVASHVLGYIGRINDRDVERIAEWERDRELQGLRLHRQGRRRAFLRARAARHHRRRGSRGRRGRSRRAHAVAHAAGVGQQPARCRSTSSCRRRRRRRSATAAARWSRSSPRTGDVLAFVSQARLRSEPLRRRHRPGELGGAQRVAGQAAAQPAAARRVSAGLDDQAVPGARRAHVRQAHAAADDLRSRASSRSPGIVASLPRRQAGRSRHRRHVQVDRRLLRHLLLRARERNRHRRHARASCRS